MGPLEADRYGRPLKLGGPKSRALLAALVCEHDRPVSTDRLVDVLWGDSPPPTATKTIQKYVSQLRKELGTVLVTHPSGYALAGLAGDVDVGRFEELVARAAKAGPSEEAIELLEEGLSLWRGDPYPELGDAPHGVAERTRLEELRLSALESLTEAELSVGRTGSLVGRLESLVSSHPFRERLWGQLMMVLYRSGRQSDALRAYQRLRRVLGDELGVEPSSELQELENRILLHEPDLGPGSSRRSSRSNLRPQLTSFVGRSRELAELEELLRTSRLVTLVGPAGSGKTRLALEAAQRYEGRFRDGVWVVDLAPLASPDQVVDAIAAPLGVSGQPKRPTENVLIEYLTGRQLLLVLDNCEHLLGKVGQLMSLLLPADEQLCALATSRQPLGVTGEVTYEVPPLPFPGQENEGRIADFDAVRLFVDRARAAHSDFRLSEANTSAVAEICRRLDGMPLALEPAAARSRTLPPSQLARHLDDRFALLTSPPHSTLARHQTLQRAVDWSYDLLSPAEQILFRRLSVFRGGFDLEAAERVCAIDHPGLRQALPLLTELADKSLVVIDPPSAETTRYRLLETFREYGQARLDSKESEKLRDAHVQHFRGLAERAAPQLRGPDQQRWVARLGADFDNLRKALRWSSSQHPESAVRITIALADYWDSVGSRAEGQEWARRAVELSKGLTPQLRIAARLAAADLFVSSHLSTSMRYAEEALEEARGLGDEIAEAKARRVLSWAHGLRGDYGEAETLGTQALSVFEKVGNSWERALTLERLGEPFHDAEQSMRYLQRSLDLYRQVGDRKRQSVVLYKLASRTAQARRDFSAATEWVEESLAICDETGNIQDGAHASLEYGTILRRQGEAARAGDVLEEALDRLRRVGDQRCSIRALTALGIAHLENGEEARAGKALRESLQLSHELDEKPASRAALAVTARLLAAGGRYDEAASLYAFADKLSRELGVSVATAVSEKRSELVDTLRAALAPDELENAWRTGEALNMDEAIALAIGIRTV